jgi:hypothetical protein
MRYRIALLAVSVLFAAVAVKAAGDHNMAGCGVGGMWVGSASNGPQVWASSTNQSSGQVYAITTGTSGCSAERGFSARIERERYVATNYRNLSREIARGEGEYAASLATVMGCSEEAVPAFLSFTRGNYDKLFPADGTPVKMLDTLESEIGSSAAMSAACTI